MFSRTMFSISLVAAIAAPASAQAPASKKQVVSIPVKGDVAFEMAAISADVRVVAGKASTIEVRGHSAEPISLSRRGNRVVAEGERGPLRTGKVEVRVPRGTDLFVNTVSGDIEVRDVGGDADLHAVSGDIEVAGLVELTAATVSGDIQADRIKGKVRAHTVSGGATIASSAGPGGRLEFATTSGDLHWQGACAAGCRIEAQSLSGTLAFALASKSSFELDFESFSGDWDDRLGLTDVQRSGTIGLRVSGRYGSGAGKIDLNSHSGSVELKKASRKRSP